MNPNLTVRAGGARDRRTGSPAASSTRPTCPRSSTRSALLAGSSAWTPTDQRRPAGRGSPPTCTGCRPARPDAAKRPRRTTTRPGTTTQVIAYALFVGERRRWRTRSPTSARTGIIAAQITASGAQPTELARADTWSYSTYNLDALARLAQLAARVPGGSLALHGAERRAASGTRSTSWSATPTPQRLAVPAVAPDHPAVPGRAALRRGGRLRRPRLRAAPRRGRGHPAGRLSPAGRSVPGALTLSQRQGA